MDMPFGLLCDLVAIEQIKNEGMVQKIKKTEQEEQEEFYSILELD